MPRGAKPKPDGEHLHKRVLTKLNNEDYADFIQMIHEDGATTSDYLRKLIDHQLKQFRLAKSKQMRLGIED